VARERSEDQQVEQTAAVHSVEATGPTGEIAMLRQAAGEMTAGMGMSPTAMLALQRTAGNQAAGRALAGSPRAIQRDGVLDAIGDAFDMRDDEDRLDAEEDLQDFRDESYDPIEDFHPSSDVGMFDAKCDMAAGTMTITLKVGFNFTAGNPAQVSAGFRPEEFQWTPEEQTEWKTRYLADVTKMWSAQFTIRSIKPHWEAMTVATTVEVIEDSGDPHFTLNVAKYPPDAEMVQSSICPPGYHHDGSGNCAANAAGDNTGTGDLDSNDMRPEQKLDWGNATTSIPFTIGSSALNAAGTAALAPIITQVAGVANAHVEITGHSSTKHKAGRTAAEGATDNMDLARARTAAVQAALIAGGATAEQILVRNVGETGAADDDSWCRVDAQVGTQQTQDPGLHETGHMLGSDDEYAQTGAPAGSAMAPKYDAMVRAPTGDVLPRGSTSDAMSVGSTVRKWNYASFMEALEKMTDTSAADWNI
jgi:outer membrane protein OmpA-like peptidoglycan-associated protein